MDIVDHKKFVTNAEIGWVRDILLLAIVFGIVFFQYLGSVPLIDPDEGRYAEIPREMLERSDLITPTLNYVKYFEKPPFLYWVNAASIKLFGQNECAARIPSALAGLLTLLATYIAARKLYGRRTALLAALILGTSAGFVLQSRIILTDMLLTFCLSASLLSFIVGAEEEKRGSSAPFYLSYLFAALAVLTKGLIGMVFPGAIIFIYLLLSKRWSLLRTMRIPSGIILFLAVSAPWFVAVSLKNPEFAHFFFIKEHFQRFTSTVHGRYQPFWFFVPVLIGTMLPWSFFIPGALGKAWRERHHEDGGSSRLFLLVWIFFIFLFFSKSGSKLVPYILPLFPALALLIAHRFDSLFDRRPKEVQKGAIVLGIILIILGIAALLYPNAPTLSATLGNLLPHYAAIISRTLTFLPRLPEGACSAIGIVFAFQGILSLTGCAQRTGVPLFTSLAICSLGICLMIPHLIMGEIARTESPRDLSLSLRERLTPDTVLASFGPMQAVSWYTGRRVVTVGNLDELEFGSKQGDQKEWFLSEAGFFDIWGGNRPVLAIMRTFELERIQSKLVPAPVLLKQTGRHLLVSNRP